MTIGCQSPHSCVLTSCTFGQHAKLTRCTHTISFLSFLKLRSCSNSSWDQALFWHSVCPKVSVSNAYRFCRTSLVITNRNVLLGRRERFKHDGDLMADSTTTVGANSKFTVMLWDRFASIREMHCYNHLLLEVLPVHYSRDPEIIYVEIFTVSIYWYWSLLDSFGLGYLQMQLLWWWCLLFIFSFVF